MRSQGLVQPVWKRAWSQSWVARYGVQGYKSRAADMQHRWILRWEGSLHYMTHCLEVSRQQSLHVPQCFSHLLKSTYVNVITKTLCMVECLTVSNIDSKMRPVAPQKANTIDDIDMLLPARPCFRDNWPVCRSQRSDRNAALRRVVVMMLPVTKSGFSFWAPISDM